MALGAKHVVKLHEYQDPNNAAVGGQVVLDSFERKVFSHNASFTVATTTVVKSDFPGSDNDAYTVTYAYPAGGEPDLTTLTVDAVRENACVAINTALGVLTADPSATDASAY